MLSEESEADEDEAPDIADEDEEDDEDDGSSPEADKEEEEEEEEEDSETSSETEADVELIESPSGSELVSVMPAIIALTSRSSSGSVLGFRREKSLVGSEYGSVVDAESESKFPLLELLSDSSF